LKDASARVDAVIWKGVYGRMRFKPEEGLEVIATGKITTFPGKSSYQIIVESIEPAGVGALMALLEERRKKLAAEGLFDPARKQLIPYLPEVIGVVTSPTGAVIRDILHRIADRFPRRVIVWPVRVQGETSAADVARAIAGFNALPEGGKIPRPSVLIVARGGGSIEDLWGFNEEVVLRAAAESDIPLVSAIGHETDTTLLDHVADLRAPTPTGAAEMCVPVRADLLANLADVSRRHDGGIRRLLDRRRSDLRAAARALPSGEAILAMPRQRLDRASERLVGRVAAGMGDRRLRLGRAAQTLAKHSPRAEYARLSEKLRNLGQRLEAGLAGRARLAARDLDASRKRLDELHRRLKPAFERGVHRRAERADGLGKLLASFSYKNVLSRGFALVRDGDDHPVRSAATVPSGARLSIEFADGRVGATADGGGSDISALAPKPPAPRPRAGRASKATGQGSLF
jgi:exodeoxyribonuclease VII large subunit